MAIALAILSIVILALSLYGVLLPRKLVALVRGLLAGPGFWSAVAIRLLLAVLLWFSAPASHTPTTFKVLAVLALVAAFALPIIGELRILKLIDYLASWPTMAVRLQCVLGLAFAGFLLWSVSLAIGAA